MGEQQEQQRSIILKIPPPAKPQDKSLLKKHGCQIEKEEGTNLYLLRLPPGTIRRFDIRIRLTDWYNITLPDGLKLKESVGEEGISLLTVVDSHEPHDQPNNPQND